MSDVRVETAIPHWAVRFVSNGPVEFVLLDDGSHVANNRAYRWRSQSADRMARQLGVPQA